MPSVIRFMVCGAVFYAAFLLLGWLVMGPYHPKVHGCDIYYNCNKSTWRKGYLLTCTVLAILTSFVHVHVNPPKS